MGDFWTVFNQKIKIHVSGDFLILEPANWSQAVSSATKEEGEQVGKHPINALRLDNVVKQFVHIVKFKYYPSGSETTRPAPYWRATGRINHVATALVSRTINCQKLTLADSNIVITIIGQKNMILSRTDFILYCPIA